jgi:hypothetical protein
MEPGKYQGNVVFTVTDALSKLGKTSQPSFFKPDQEEPVCYEHEYKAALFVDVDENGNAKVDKGRSVTAALQGAEFDDNGIRGGKIVNREEYFNGILVADGKYRISDMEIDYDANGGDDFELYGAAVAVGGYADVVVDNVNITTRGSIATTVAAGEKCTVLVENSTLTAEGIDDRKYRDDCMTEAPWVLGIRGTVRASNVLSSADVTFYNVKGQSNGWGVFSTDDAVDCKHKFVNTSAKIAADAYYKSGYGNYILGNSTSNFFGIDYDIATYGFILTGKGKDVHVGPSSKENLVKFIGADSRLAAETNGFADVEERGSVIRAGRSAFMWHGDRSSDSVVYIQPGTKLITGGPTFLVRGQSRPTPDGKTDVGACPHIDVDGAEIENGGVLLHYAEGDDAGIGGSGFDKHWAEFYEVPEVKYSKFPGHNVSDPDEDGSMGLTVRNTTVSGDVYNSVYKNPQNLSLKLDNTAYSGAVSTGVQYHVNFKPGEKIGIENALEIGNLGVTPVGDFCNGIIVELKNGSAWTVTGESHITALIVDGTSAVKAPEGKTLSVTVNGAPAAIGAGKLTGDICIEVK